MRSGLCHGDTDRIRSYLRNCGPRTHSKRPKEDLFYQQAQPFSMKRSKELSLVFHASQRAQRLNFHGRVTCIMSYPFCFHAQQKHRLDQVAQIKGARSCPRILSRHPCSNLMPLRWVALSGTEPAAAPDPSTVLGLLTCPLISPLISLATAAPAAALPVPLKVPLSPVQGRALLLLLLLPIRGVLSHPLLATSHPCPSSLVCHNPPRAAPPNTSTGPRAKGRPCRHKTDH